MERSLKIEFQILYRRWGIKHKARCPCCGDLLKDKEHADPKKPGYYLGCISYPACKGGRFRDGKPIFNQFTHDFLKKKQEIGRERNYPRIVKPIRLGRFIDIE